MQHEDFSIALFGKQSLLCLPNKDKVTSLIREKLYAENRELFLLFIYLLAFLVNYPTWVDQISQKLFQDKQSS